MWIINRYLSLETLVSCLIPMGFFWSPSVTLPLLVAAFFPLVTGRFTILLLVKWSVSLTCLCSPAQGSSCKILFKLFKKKRMGGLNSWLVPLSVSMVVASNMVITLWLKCSLWQMAGVRDSNFFWITFEKVYQENVKCFFVVCMTKTLICAAIETPVGPKFIPVMFVVVVHHFVERQRWRLF